MSLRSRRDRRESLSRPRSAFDQLISAIKMPVPFDLQAFCDRVAAYRGRPLHLHSAPGVTGSDAPCGVWIATEAADHIFHEEATSPLHRVHIVLHEVSHMLLGHSSLSEQRDTARLFTEIDPATVTDVLARTSYGTEDERDAEVLAGLLARRAGLSSRDARPMPSQVLQRLNDALSDS